MEAIISSLITPETLKSLTGNAVFAAILIGVYLGYKIKWERRANKSNPRTDHLAKAITHLADCIKVKDDLRDLKTFFEKEILVIQTVLTDKMIPLHTAWVGPPGKPEEGASYTLASIKEQYHQDKEDKERLIPEFMNNQRDVKELQKSVADLQKHLNKRRP